MFAGWEAAGLEREQRRIKPDRLTHEKLRALLNLDENAAEVLAHDPKPDHVHPAEEQKHRRKRSVAGHIDAVD